MKKILTTSGVTLALLLTAAISSASPITVGTANVGNCLPFMCNESGSAVGQSIRYQQVYAASSLAGLTSVDSLTFFRQFAQVFGGSPNLDSGTFQVSLSTTSAAVNGLSTTLASNVGADNALFFSGALSGSATPSFTIFGTSFLYNPANGNLLLDIVVTNQANIPNGSGNGYNDADGTGSVTSRAFSLGAGGGLAGPDGLVTQFNGGAAAVPEPATLVLLGSGLATAAVRRRRRLS